jgi:hypothetical protein
MTRLKISLRSNRDALMPLKRVKGKVRKVKNIKFITSFRYLYLNPIEGVLIIYKHTNHFPHKPHHILKLLDIDVVELMLENKWYFGNGFYYF